MDEVRQYNVWQYDIIIFLAHFSKAGFHASPLKEKKVTINTIS